MDKKKTLEKAAEVNPAKTPPGDIQSAVQMRVGNCHGTNISAMNIAATFSTIAQGLSKHFRLIRADAIRRNGWQGQRLKRAFIVVLGSDESRGQE